ncbi:hypothetical protein D9M69_732010 [compost metagenome]
MGSLRRTSSGSLMRRASTPAIAAISSAPTPSATSDWTVASTMKGSALSVSTWLTTSSTVK